MHVYARPRLAAAASRLVRGLGQPKTREGMPAALPVTADASFTLGRVLGSRTRLSCQLPLDTPGRSRGSLMVRRVD